tara:strand:- start:1146 stop:1490 length:345 start_codon:yes stop_codon:yes gene_type:complete
MRVRISYGLDIKDVPEQVTNLLQNSIEKMHMICDLLERACEDVKNCEENSEHVISMLEKVRKSLGANDLAITDVQSIMMGLANYYNGEQNVSDRRPAMDPSGDTTSTTKDPGGG